jgi:hypothetical protein
MEVADGTAVPVRPVSETFHSRQEQSALSLSQILDREACRQLDRLQRCTSLCIVDDLGMHTTPQLCCLNRLLNYLWSC